LVRVRTTRYTVVEGNDKVTIMDLTDNVINAIKQIVVKDSSIIQANEIVKRIADGLIDVPKWFITNNVAWYNNGQITATEFINAFNHLKIEQVITEMEGATTQAKPTGSSQGKGEPEIITVVAPAVVEDIVTGRPRTLDELAALPVKKENTINRVIAGLFMGGIALAFMGGLKKK
jgi:hypothetical protein